MTMSSLSEIHEALCHPGVTRMLHFRPQPGSLIKATQPMEWLSIDFKGPLPTSSRNAYLLTVVYEYSRYPFAFPCSDMHSSTVIKCLGQIFSMCGATSYIHSDRGTSFLSKELKEHLSLRGIATSKTTPYHPNGNGQCERYNGIIWQAVRLSLKTTNLPVTNWEQVLLGALHSIRSLLYTATNATPHERFFNFQRRSSLGVSLPSWLLHPGPVLLCRFVRTSKNDPLVDQVQLAEANPSYALVEYPDGRQSTVSLCDLAPCPVTPVEDIAEVAPIGEDNPKDKAMEPNPTSPTSNQSSQQPAPAQEPELRRSSCQAKPPCRYGW